MSKQANQHFVPQFYFKHFNGGHGFIHLLLKAKDRIVFNASVKGQCARHQFYGPKEIDAVFSELEHRHATAIRTTVSAAWNPHAPRVTPEMLVCLMEAVLFQRSRTALEVEKQNPAMESLCLEMFKQYLVHAPDISDRDKIIEAIESGRVRITQNPQAAVLNSISIALESVPLISDLGIYLIRNQTDYPFLFSDAPVVLCNTYLRNVTTRGVVGIQTPGLQIFLPLDSRTTLMLIDEGVYSGHYKIRHALDIMERSDVSQLNAIQLQHSLNAIYFADRGSADYVNDLWRAHKPSIVPPRNVFRIMRNALIDGEPQDGPIYHAFEPQLNVSLSLSFIECTPIPEAEYRFLYRSPELVAEHKKRYPDMWDA